MNAGLTLWAGIGDWIGALFPIIVAIIYVVGQLIGKQNADQDRRAGRPAGRGHEPGRPEPQRRPPPAARGAQPADEVEEFLRRVGKLREQQAQQGPRRPPLAEPVLAEPELEPEEGPSRHMRPVGGVVESHTQEYLNTGTFQQRAQRLSHVQDTSAVIAQEVSQKFEHAVGSFTAPRADVTTRQAEEPQQQQHPILRTLSNPLLVRDAFIIGELLRRQDDRIQRSFES